MTRGADTWLERRSTVYAACAASFALGVFFIFVWTPLPWGWQGIDDYYRIGLLLARGEPFPTVHLVWGYAYFLAFFYRLFGDHPWIPLCAQAALNACIPLMLYHLVRRQFGDRVAVVSALLAGVCSFNTVYASTQSSDSVCTVLVVAMMLCFAIGDQQRRVRWFVAAGVIAGAAYQFRPNLILFPAFIGGLFLARSVWLQPDRMARLKADTTYIAAFVLAFILAAAPWVIRNYRWAGLFIPASTHGGVQLWFGTLQTRGFQDSWLYNPRAAFEFPPVDYTSVDELPLVVTATAANCRPPSPEIALVYWTSRDRPPQRIVAARDAAGQLTATIPKQPSATAVYYYFEGTTDSAANPRLVVVSRDHLGDLDVDNHVLDVFDIARMLARHDPAADAEVRRDVPLLLEEREDPVEAIDHRDGTATIRFRDTSLLSVPSGWSGRITDLRLETPVVNSAAARMVNRSRSLAGPTTVAPPTGSDPCLALEHVGANRTPNRRLPHEQRRFIALALDNIRADPWGFATASAWRALRVFVVAGSGDRRTAYQFSGAAAVYAIARALSIAYIVVFVAGVVVAWRRRLPLFMLLTPIVYVPLTICFMLINARYSMTTQPFVFAFVAVALLTATGADRHR